MMTSWITTTAQAKVLADRLLHRKQRVCGLDCETEGIDPRTQPAAGPHGRIVCWSVAWDGAYAGVWANPETWAVLGPVLTTLPAVGHNLLGFDSHMFRKAGVEINPVADTLRIHKLIVPDEDAEHGLKSLMKWWLKREPVGEFLELFSRRECLGVDEGPVKHTKRLVDGYKVPTVVGGSWSRLSSKSETIPLSSIPTEYPDLMETLYEYACLDAVATLDLYRMFTAKMESLAWEIPLHARSSGV